MARYITNIHVNKLFHLSDFDIPVADDNAPHLILTGKNGSGKTITLNAIADLLDKIKEDADLIYQDYPKWMRTLNDVNKVDSRKILTNELLFFLSDLKIQEALARNEQQNADADKIKDWFESFENVLKNFFEDKDLKLRFNYRDYTFHIETQGKSFKFTELSDGFSAIIDIIADLILKMQKKDTLVMDYLKPGIVLIDEIETHLHLQLQKTVLPLLTKLFPNIQFIVTTHSPFVLNSLPNATAFDMEHRETIVNLSDYSYQALTEGYFGVSSDSDYIKARLEQLRELLAKEQLTDEETETTKQIIADFRNMPEAVSPAITGRFNGLLVDYSFGENIKWNKQ